MIRGEIRWYTFRLPDKRRPVLILKRDEVIGTKSLLLPLHVPIRGLRTEVVLTEEDGMPAACAVNFDHLSPRQRDRFGAVLCTLPGKRWPEVRTALLTACGFEQSPE